MNSLTSTSTSPPIPAFDRALADDVAALRNTAEPCGRDNLTLPEPIAPALRDRMAVRLRALTVVSSAAAVDRKRAGLAVAQLLDCFPQLARGDAKALTAKFVL